MVPTARRTEGEVAVLVKRDMFEDNRCVRKRIMPGELRIHGGCDQKSEPQRPTSSHVSGYGLQLATRITLVPSYPSDASISLLFTPQDLRRQMTTWVHQITAESAACFGGPQSKSSVYEAALFRNEASV